MDLPRALALRAWVILFIIIGRKYVTADSSEEGRPFPPFAPFSPFGFPLAPVPFIGRAPPLAAFRIAPPLPLPLPPAAPSPGVPIQPIVRLVGPPLPAPDGVAPFPLGFDSSGSGSFEYGSSESNSGSGSFEGFPPVAGAPSQSLQVVAVGVIHEPKQYAYEATTYAPYVEPVSYKEEPVKAYEYKPEAAKIVLQPVIHKKKPKKYGGYETKPVKATEKLAEVPAVGPESPPGRPTLVRPATPPLSPGSEELPIGQPNGPEMPAPVVLPGPPSNATPNQRPALPPPGPVGQPQAQPQPEVMSSVTQIKVEVRGVPQPPPSSPQGRQDDGNVSVEDNRPPVKKAYSYPEGKYDRTEAYPQRYGAQEVPRPYVRAYEVEEYGESEGYRGAVNYPGYTNSRDLRPRPLF